MLAQTLPGVELLLCDDGSGEVSSGMARRWVAAFPDRVRYVEHVGHAHRGMSSTRNLGIDAARGELVAFLDADDVWEPGHLGHEVALLGAHPEAGLVCGQAVYWASWEDPAAVDVQYPLPWPPGVVVPPPQMLTALLRRGTFRTPTCSLLVREPSCRPSGVPRMRSRAVRGPGAVGQAVPSAPVVISGTRTARYRKHDGSSTAQALRSGANRHDRPNVSREAFLRWLSCLPQIRAPGRRRDERSAAARRLWCRMSGGAAGAAAGAVGGAGGGAGAVAAGGAGGGASGAGAGVGPGRVSAADGAVESGFGADRGLPIDRYYVERFLAENARASVGGCWRWVMRGTPVASGGNG